MGVDGKPVADGAKGTAASDQLSARRIGAKTRRLIGHIEDAVVTNSDRRRQMQPADVATPLAVDRKALHTMILTIHDPRLILRIDGDRMGVAEAPALAPDASPTAKVASV